MAGTLFQKGFDETTPISARDRVLNGSVGAVWAQTTTEPNWTEKGQTEKNC